MHRTQQQRLESGLRGILSDFGYHYYDNGDLIELGCQYFPTRKIGNYKSMFAACDSLCQKIGADFTECFVNLQKYLQTA